MATIKLGAIVTEIAGSIGGTTFRRGRNFTAITNKTQGASSNRTLKNPALVQIGSIARSWSVMSITLQNQWKAAALLFQFPDKFGVLKNLTGRQLYIKLTNFNANAGLASPDPTALDSFVEDSFITASIIYINSEAYVQFSPLSPKPYTAIMIELIKYEGVSPTYTRRAITKFEQTDGSNRIYFLSELMAKYPLLADGNIIRVYYYNQNEFGFKNSVLYQDVVAVQL